MPQVVFHPMKSEVNFVESSEISCRMKTGGIEAVYVLAADGAYYNADMFAKIEAHANNRSEYGGLGYLNGYACHMQPLETKHLTIHVTEPEAVLLLETALRESSRFND